MESKRLNNKSRGRGRGVLALTSYEPCPRPSASTIGMWHRPSSQQGIGKNANGITNTNGEVGNSTKTINTNHNNNPKIVQNGYCQKDIRNKDNTQNGYDNNDNPNNVIKTSQMSNGQNGIKENPEINGNIKNTTVVHHPQMEFSDGDLIAKYNYKGKPDRPGGFDEISLTQGEKLKLIRKGHTETKNPHWWEVINEKGEQGFVPGNYCMVVEQKPTTLPWLENKRLLEEKEQKARDAEMKAKGDAGFGAPAGPPKVKAYQSAYTNNGPAPKNTAEASKEYYCEICDKNLNGPQPYKSHMSSRAHREEVEYQQSK